MNRIIQMEVNHATGKLLADVEYFIKDKNIGIIRLVSIKSPVTGWDMFNALKGEFGFSSSEIFRILEVCRNA